MVSTKVTALLGAFATSAVAVGTSKYMGPAALMWPPDRKWTDADDNTGPCGSSAGVGERTTFPLKNGKLALVTQDEVRAVHISVSYKSNPTTQDDFETFFGPDEVGSLGLGHTCITVPDAPSDISAGDVATFSMMYVANFATNEADRTFHYACSDVQFVELATFDEYIPCFNTTIEDPEVKVDPTVNVVTTDSNGNSPHTVEDFTTGSKKSGLATGEIAGVVVGAVAGLGLIGAAVWFFRRRSAQKKKEEEQMRQIDAEKANDDTLSTRS